MFSVNSVRYLLFIVLLLLNPSCNRPRLAADLSGLSSGPAELCPAARPDSRLLVPRSSPRVQRALSPKILASASSIQKCVIDHRTALPKTFQYKTGFCHVHAFSELWNTSVEPTFQLDTASLSLQIWMQSFGSNLDEIMTSEIKFLRNLLAKQPIRNLTGSNSMFLLGMLPQGGNMAENLRHLQRAGAYQIEDAPKLSFQEIETMTARIHDARKALISSSMRGLSDQQIEEKMKPIYEEIIDRAWKKNSLSGEKPLLEPSKKFAEGFSMKEIPFSDSEATRTSFLEDLKQRPLGVSRSGHAIVVAGYEPSTLSVWIRDSYSWDAYYSMPLDEFFQGVARYFYLQKAN